MMKVKLFVMDSAVKRSDLRLMLTHKLIGKTNADREVPGLARVFAPYKRGNNELARQIFQKAQEMLLREADTLESGKNISLLNFDATLLKTAKFWDAKLLGGCLELLQMELQGIKINDSLMVHADGMMVLGKEMKREGSKADDHFVKKTVLGFGEALIERGQALHDFVWQGDEKGL